MIAGSSDLLMDQPTDRLSDSLIEWLMNPLIHWPICLAHVHYAATSSRAVVAREMDVRAWRLKTIKSTLSTKLGCIASGRQVEEKKRWPGWGSCHAVYTCGWKLTKSRQRALKYVNGCASTSYLKRAAGRIIPCWERCFFACFFLSLLLFLPVFTCFSPSVCFTFWFSQHFFSECFHFFFLRHIYLMDYDYG